jgi:type II secretory pathway pseudopilin PulG
MNSLLELTLVIAIISILGTSLVTFGLKPYQESWAASTVLQTLFTTRMQALATDKTCVITPTMLTPIVQKSHTTILLNVSNLGFTSNGTTNKAGTLTLGTRPYLITLGVGYGQPRLR